MLRVRWLGRVPYEEAHVLQRALHDRPRDSDQYLLMLEHPDVVTLGLRGDMSHVLADIEPLGAEVLRTDRGGDVTYHGPGQLVVYPIVDVPTGRRAIPCFVHKVEQLVIDALADIGLETGTTGRTFPGVWVDPGGVSPRKICAIGIRVTRGRSMHGLALNVDPDMDWFSRIVPCGIQDKGVTSLAAEGIDGDDGTGRRGRLAGHAQGRSQAVGLPASSATSARTLPGCTEMRPRLSELGHRVRRRGSGCARPGSTRIVGLSIRERKPSWSRAPVVIGDGYRSLGRTMRDLDLVTVCEEAGCPNIYECWSEGTATFMINGERCTRACGFCLVDTRHPLPIDPQEPGRVAEAVARMGLAYAVVTAVARDDLGDGGAAGFVRTVAAIRDRCPGTSVEVLIPDCKGDPDALESIFASRPEVLNHNLETVARLQRAVQTLRWLRPQPFGSRPSRKSRPHDQVRNDPRDGRRPPTRYAGPWPIYVPSASRSSPSASICARAPVTSRLRAGGGPEEFEELGSYAWSLGFAHVESSPLTRSSYHARSALENTTTGQERVDARLRA